MGIRKSILWAMHMGILCMAVFLLVSAVWILWQNRSDYGSRPAVITDGVQLLQSRPPPFSSATPLKSCNAYKEDISTQPFKSWNRSVVTLMEPEIPRNCSALFSGDAAEIDRVAQAQQNWKSSSYNQKFNKLFIESENCEEIRTDFDGNFYVSEEEVSFPLAFSMTVHDDAQQIMRFLKAIYRPQNVYCIHYDKKSSSTFQKIFNNLAKCLKNVIIPKKIVNIVYECYPILEAQLSCMRDLLEMRKEFPWKYTTTLCGKEFPLRTNREMVRLLWQMKGYPVINVHDFLPGEYSVKMHRMIIKKNACKRTGTIQNQPVPYGMKLLKSMAYFSLTPEFTDFVLNSPEGKALYNFVKPIKGPEETFFSTLFNYWRNETESNVAFQSRIAGTIWLPIDNPSSWRQKCNGSIVHRVCIVSSGDLHRLTWSLDSDHVRYPLFHNKYSMATDHTVMDCVEELLVERNKHEFLRDLCSNRTKQLESTEYTFRIL